MCALIIMAGVLHTDVFQMEVAFVQFLGEIYDFFDKNGLKGC